jgi:hypothetical protein
MLITRGQERMKPGTRESWKWGGFSDSTSLPFAQESIILQCQIGTAALRSDRRIV